MQVALFNEEETFAWFQDRLTKLDTTQTELSKQSGISASDISRYISRKQYPRMSQLKKLADALDVNEIELMVGLGVIDGAKPPVIRKSKFGASVKF